MRPMRLLWLTRLVQDLRGDGWMVYRRDVSPSIAVPDLKQQSVNDHADHPHINPVFFFGKLPVPTPRLPRARPMTMCQEMVSSISRR
jgi:hypothetical protein